MTAAYGQSRDVSILRDHLILAGARLARIDDGLALATARLVLAETDPGLPAHCRSTLNNDGSALQVCVTSSQSRRTVRLLGDPTALMDESDYKNAGVRFERARQALWRLLEFANCELLRPTCDCILKMLLPTDAASAERMTGPLWLGTGLGCPGVAAYVNARRVPVREQWTRLAECLQATAPGDEGARLMTAALPFALPASLGIEGAGMDDARVKVYWRLRQAISLKELRCPLFVEPPLVHFLDLMLGRRPIGISGLVFGAGFGVGDGHLRDVKIDVCGHCIPLSAEEWFSTIERIATDNGLVDMDLEPALRSGDVEIALVGFGVDVLGRRRLNLYLKCPKTWFKHSA